MTVQQALTWLRLCAVCLALLHSCSAHGLLLQSSSEQGVRQLTAVGQEASSRPHSRRLQQVSTAAISSFLTIGGGKDDASFSTPVADLSAVAGTPLHSQQPLSPQLATEVQQAQQNNLEGEAPGNEEPYAYNLSNPDVVPNANVDSRSTNILGAPAPSPSSASSSISPIFIANPNASTQGSWALIGLSGCIAIHASLSPSNEILFFERPHTTGGGNRTQNPYLTFQESTSNGLQYITEVSALYDLDSNNYSPIRIKEAPFCAGHIFGPTEQTIIIGGDNRFLNGSTLVNGLQTVRKFDFQLEQIIFDKNLSTPRWYPSLATLASGNVFVSGGSIIESGGYYANTEQYNNPTYQIYSPRYNTMTPSIYNKQLADSWPIVLYPFLYVMPFSGSLLQMAGNSSIVYRNVDFTRDPGYADIPELEVPFNHPQTATILALPLDPSRNFTVTIMVMGGCASDKCSRATPSSNSSYRIDVGSQPDTWVREEMPAPRVMGYSTLLPDGTVFVANGAQIGFAGGFPGAGFAKAPVTQPCIYDPDAPPGLRWSELLADSDVPRLYHSVLLLLPTGEILVAGSEVTLEYKIQIFTPPYLLNGNTRPTIESAPVNMSWHQTYDVVWSGTQTIERIVLQKLADSTHSLAWDLRQIVLRYYIKDRPGEDGANGTLTLTSPPGDTFAPPGMYMLFLLSRGTPSHAWYIRIVPQQLPNPDAPLVNGTYQVLNVGRSEACNGQNSPQYLSRPENCGASSELTVSNLTVHNTLETKWEIALVPGSVNRYFIYTPIKALLGCASLFVRPAACQGDDQVERTVNYGVYSGSDVQWTFYPVADQNPYTFRIVAQSLDADPDVCGPVLSGNGGPLCSDNTITTRPQDDDNPTSQYWQFTLAS